MWSATSNLASVRRATTGERRVLVEFVRADSSFGVGGALADRDHPQVQAPDCLLLAGTQRAVDVFGRVCHRVFDSACCLVARQGERHALASPPRLEQRVRDQRENPGLPGRVGHDPRHQGGFDLVPVPYGRGGDRLPQLLGGEGTEMEIPVPPGVDQVRAQLGVAVEARAYSQHDPYPAGLGGRGEENGLGEPRAFAVAAQRDHLLELVDDQQEVIGVLTHRLPDAQVQVRRVGGQVRVPRRGGVAGERGQVYRACLGRICSWRDDNRPSRPRACPPCRPSARRS
ncbi:hypothetical protein ALI144C_22935 [Actinosynnema sp. ALI-1.44]|nr:hypothetical protein ALI144C_22935 [Actinosynnema sp. ALI-1.44]